MALSAQYQYTTLVQASSIRLLELEPAVSLQAEIRGSLIDSALSGSTEYEALSYVWGTDDSPSILHLHGQCLKITDSLASALRGFRLANVSRILWVDAVCIDQTDAIEKAQQVAQMAMIYKNATKVVAWLGEGPHSLFDVQSCQTLSQKAQEIGLQSPSDNNGETVRAWVYGDSERVGWLLSFMSLIKDSGFPAVYESAWFTRMWIIQEALLAERLILYTGTASLEWDDFERVMILIQAVSGATRLPMPHRDAFVKYAWNLVEVRRTWRHRRQVIHKDYSSEAPEIMFYMHQLR